MSKEKRTNCIDIKGIFSKAFDKKSFDKNLENNIVWQALSDNPSFILPITHYAHAIVEKEKRLKKERKHKDMLLLLLSIQVINRQIEKQMVSIRETVDNIYVLGGDIIDEINRIQNQIERFENEHNVAENLITRGRLNGKEITEFKNENIKALYARYIERVGNTNHSLQDTLLAQIEYDRNVHIPWLTSNRDELGILYNQTISYAQNIGKQLTSLESRHKQIIEMEDTAEKLMALEDINLSLQDLDDLSGKGYNDLVARRDMLIERVNNGIENSTERNHYEVKETTIAVNLNAFKL